MFNSKPALAIQQSPYIIKRRGPRGEEDSDSGFEETAVTVAKSKPKQQHPLSLPRSYPKPKGKQLIAHPKLQTTNLCTSSSYVVKRAHSQIPRSSHSRSGSGGSEEMPMTPATPNDRTGSRTQRPVSPAATMTTFHTAQDDDGTMSGQGHDYGRPLEGTPYEWTPYEYPTPPPSASTSNPSVPTLDIPSTTRTKSGSSSE